MHSYGGNKEFTDSFLKINPNFNFSFSFGGLNVEFFYSKFCFCELHFLFFNRNKKLLKQFL